MNVFLVFAHPDPRSLSASLRTAAADELTRQGHQVRVSDLYAMTWQACINRGDFPALPTDERLLVPQASRQAFLGETLTADVRAEQDKMAWADAMILQFPLWWFSMPAILKGWVDRVFSHSFAYGVGEHSSTHWGDRYGEGRMAGKRAMMITTVGGWEDHYSERGINGPIADLLFPIHHGILQYTGFDVLPPFALYKADRIDQTRYQQEEMALRARMRDLFTTSPIAYRKQNFGDYSIPDMQLREGLEAPGTQGFALHLSST